MKRFIALAVALTGLLTVGLPGVAWAHASLQSSTPGSSSVLESSPPEIALDFDEEISAGLSSIQLYDQQGAEVVLGPVQAGADASIVHATVPDLAAGLYAVIWRVSSADGHVIDGSLSFQVGTEASTVDALALINDVRSGSKSPASVGRTMGVARFAAYLGAALLLGGLALVLLSGAAYAHRWSTRRLLWMGWLLLAVGSAANFALLGAKASAGTVGDMLRTSVWGDIANTRTGAMLVARLVLCLALVPVIMVVAHDRRPSWSLLMPMLGVTTVFTFSAAGHPSVSEPAALWMAIDAVHLGLIVFWIGGLTLMALAPREWLLNTELDGAVRRFSRASTVGVPLIVVTGVAQTLKLAGGWDTLTATSWGRVLLAKSAVVALAVTLGAASRWLLQHDGPGGLRRTVTVEAVLAVGVLGLAAGLVSLPPRPVAPSALFNTTLTQGTTLADISVAPGRVGANEVHIIVTPAGGNLKPITDLKARMSLASKDIVNLPVQLTTTGPNHYTGTISLPFPGEWILELVIAPSATESVLMNTTVNVP